MPTSWTTPSHPSSRLRERLRHRRGDIARTRRHQDSTPALVPVVNAADDVSPALERLLLPTVLRAHAGCHDARDALYIALLPKLERFIRGIRVPRLRPDQVGLWDQDDVEQEAWLVFDDLIRQWTPDRPFGRYILATFPWRLRDAIFRGIGRRPVPPRMTTVPIGDQDWLHDGSADADEAHALLNALADHLPGVQGAILRRHVGKGETLTAIARDLDLSRRTVTRQWRAVRDHLATGMLDTSSTRHMA
ncbi:MAG TPA: sigma-70 family RNA polymerase sigma factor [Thermomicrobiales bacterium]|nr:sigma-70 family RNA polymerase sigma factor [Thermomicrobiales bacterium]